MNHVISHDVIGDCIFEFWQIFIEHTVRVLNFVGKIFCVFSWQENLWGINFHGHGGVIGTIVVEYARY